MIAKLKNKMQLGFILVSFICIVIIGFLAFYFGRSGIVKGVEKDLIVTQSLKRAQISDYFANISAQVLFLSKGTFFNLLPEFTKAFFKVKEELKTTDAEVDKYRLELKKYYEENVFKELNLISDQPKKFEDFAPRDPNAIILQYLYLVKNPNPVGRKYELDDANDGSAYSKLHAIYQPIFRFFLKTFKHANVYFFDSESGYCVYSTKKYPDFANNAFDGALADSNLGNLIKQLLSVGAEDETRMVDFAFYDFAHAEPKSFLGSPTFKEGKKIGFFVIEISINSLNNLINDEKNWEEVGLGKTGENYLVGFDYKMRSQPRRFYENFDTYLENIARSGQTAKNINRIRLYDTAVLLQEVTTRPVQAALNGQIGVMEAINKEGVSVISAYAPLGLPDVNWVIITQMDKSEALAPTYKLAKLIFLVGILLLIFSFILSFRYISYVLRPIRVMRDQIKEVVESKKLDLNSKFNFESGILGEMASLLNNLFDKLRKSILNLGRISEEFSNVLFKLKTNVTDIKQSQTIYDILENTTKNISFINNQTIEFKEQNLKLSLVIKNIDSYLLQYQNVSKRIDELSHVNKNICSEFDAIYKKSAYDIEEILMSSNQLDDLFKSLINIFKENTKIDFDSAFESINNQIEASIAKLNQAQINLQNYNNKVQVLMINATNSKDSNQINVYDELKKGSDQLNIDLLVATQTISGFINQAQEIVNLIRRQKPISSKSDSDEIIKTTGSYQQFSQKMLHQISKLKDTINLININALKLQESNEKLDFYLKELLKIYEYLQSELNIITSIEYALSKVSNSFNEQILQASNAVTSLIQHQNQIKFKTEDINQLVDQGNKIKKEIDEFLSNFLVEEK